MLLLGVTDTPYEGAPGEVAPTNGDVDGLFEDASRFIAPELLGHDRVRHAFAGLRVLPFREGDTRHLPRGHLIATGPGGMISVAGGKLTTHRVIAIDVLSRLPADLRPKRLRASAEPLPGAGLLPKELLLTGLDRDVADHLLHLYGSEAGALLDYRELEPAALERIDPAGPDVWAQVHYAVEHEWARTVDDVVKRRTTLALRGLDNTATRTRIQAVLASGPRESRNPSDRAGALVGGR